MRKFGLWLEYGNSKLVDLETGEIVAETPNEIQKMLVANENNCTLQLI